jgi:DNA repair photolyase
VNTKLLDYVPENKIERMSLMPEKMRAILENGASYNKRVQFLEKLFQAGYSTHINFSPIIYHDKNWAGTKNSSTSLTTKYQRSLKNSRSRMYFLTHNANLHKINLEKGLLRKYFGH